MKKILIILFLTLGSLLSTIPDANAQTIELVAGNTLNGAVNGVLLGGATMALSDNDDFRPVEVGLGAGTLYGLGVGIYDLSQVNSGQQFYISGTFNDGTNSSVLVLLDTFYGVAGGSLIASSVALIVKEPILDALQYGAGIGAWAGFGFGLIDSFMLAKGPNYSATAVANTSQVNGMITYRNSSSTIEAGLFSPSATVTKEISGNNIKTSINPAIDVLQLHIKF